MYKVKIRRFRLLSLILTIMITAGLLTGCDFPSQGFSTDKAAANRIIAAKSSDRVVRSEANIAKLNESIFAAQGIGMVRPDKLGQITSSELREMIDDASFPSKEYLNGKKITDSQKNSIINNRNMPSAGYSAITVRYAIATSNASVRTYPTGDKLSNDVGRFDYLQETGLYLGEPMAVLWTSSDGDWVYVQASNYRGWVDKTELGFCDEKFFKAYCRMYFDGDPLSTKKIAGGARLSRAVAFTSKNVLVSAASEDIYSLSKAAPKAASFRASIVSGEAATCTYSLWVRMGTILPMGKSLYYPKRDNDGNCIFVAGALDRTDILPIGHLGFSEKNILTQAVKLLGTPYSWGDTEEHGMDCSSTLNSVFRCFGLFLARNTGDQQKMPITSVDLSGMDSGSKKALISNMSPGTLLYFPGHVMMLLGEYDGTLFLLHNNTSTAVNNGTLEFYSCIITPIETGVTGNTYLDRLTKAVKIVP